MAHKIAVSNAYPPKVCGIPQPSRGAARIYNEPVLVRVPKPRPNATRPRDSPTRVRVPKRKPNPTQSDIHGEQGINSVPVSILHNKERSPFTASKHPFHSSPASRTVIPPGRLSPARNEVKSHQNPPKRTVSTNAAKNCQTAPKPTETHQNGRFQLTLQPSSWNAS